MDLARLAAICVAVGWALVALGLGLLLGVAYSIIVLGVGLVAFGVLVDEPTQDRTVVADRQAP